MKNQKLQTKLTLKKATISNLRMGAIRAGADWTTLPETQYWGCSFAVCPTTGDAVICEDRPDMP